MDEEGLRGESELFEERKLDSCAAVKDCQVRTPFFRIKTTPDFSTPPTNSSTWNKVCQLGRSRQICRLKRSALPEVQTETCLDQRQACSKQMIGAFVSAAAGGKSQTKRRRRRVGGGGSEGRRTSSTSTVSTRSSLMDGDYGVRRRSLKSEA